ncbi:MAG: mechanosensitive ion channel [Azospirillaceae bacterium]
MPVLVLLALWLGLAAVALAQQQSAPEEAPATATPASQDAATGETSASAAEGAEAAEIEQAAADLGVSPEQAQDLIDTLQDEAARAQLIERLTTLTAVQPGEPDGVDLLRNDAELFLQQQAGLLETRAVHVGQAFQSVTQIWDGLVDLFDSPIARDRFVQAMLDVAIVVAIGLAARWLVSWALMGVRRRLSDRGHTASRGLKVLLLVARFVVDLLPLAVLFVATMVLTAALTLSSIGGVIGTSVLAALLVTGLVSALSRVVLAPRTPGLRLIRASDARARYLYRWTMIIARTFFWGYFAADALFLFGASGPVRAGLLVLAGGAASILAIVYIVQNRRVVRALIKKARRAREQFPGLRRLIAETWHFLAIFYVLVFFLVWCAEFEQGFAFMLRATLLSLAILAVARALGNAVEWLNAKSKEGSENRRRYLNFLRGAVQILVVALAAIFLLQVWAIDIFGVLGTEFGSRAVRAMVTIVILIGVAVLAWELISGILERRMSGKDSRGREIEQSARLRTLLPLVRNALLIILFTVVGLMVLSEIGIDIAPLLAGAGVVGLAIGFGAQTLVKDVITGLFIVLEDQIHIGDVVDTGGHSGLVEGMTIRTLRLRDLSGTVHIIPFSQVATVKNLTKDFSYYVFNIGVAYREDVDLVIEEVKKLGAELLDDPDFGPLMLGDIEVLGLDEFADSAVVVKARIKTLPIQQWKVGREFNRRMKRRFDEKGIEIPFPHVTLYWGVDKQGKAPPGFLNVDVPNLTLPAEEVEADEDDGESRPARRRRRVRTTPQRGDDAAESTLGHDDE